MNKRIVTITEVDNGWHVLFCQIEGLEEQTFIFKTLAEAESDIHSFLTDS